MVSIRKQQHRKPGGNNDTFGTRKVFGSLFWFLLGCILTFLVLSPGCSIDGNTGGSTASLLSFLEDSTSNTNTADADTAGSTKQQHPHLVEKQHSLPVSAKHPPPPPKKNTNSQIVPVLQQQESIRQWGCDRQSEEVFVFVHIGKAGGGNVRVRISLAARNVTRHPLNLRGLDDHWYPMRNNQYRGKFCSSKLPNYRVAGTKWPEKLETTVECDATTPLGMMVACPGKGDVECGNCTVGSDFCGTVYVGHNLLGSEMHFMNHYSLKKWWTDHPNLYPGIRDEVMREIDLQHPDQIWCQATQDRVPDNPKEKYAKDKDFVEKCSRNRSSKIDNFLLKHPGAQGNFASIYASMPVLRVTLVRDPFPWFLSRFFWLGRNVKCDDIDAAVDFPKNLTQVDDWIKGAGWMIQDAYLYLFFLCGEDCAARHEKGIATLSQLEAQAASNLRQSFAVVGLLDNTEQFFDMIDARVKYMDFSTVNNGNKNPSRGGEEKNRCKAVYADKTFQNKLKERLPVLASLERLYSIAVEVNKAHVEDLGRCSTKFRKKYLDSAQISKSIS